MTIYTSTLTIVALCLLSTKMINAGPILIEESTVAPTSFDNSADDETSEMNELRTNLEYTEVSGGTNRAIEGLHDLNLNTGSYVDYNLYESLTDDEKVNTENIRNELILDLIDNRSILDDYDLGYYDFSDYQESIKELIDGKHLIPMKLISWKENIDNMVYGNTNSTLSPDYYMSDFEEKGKNNRKTRKRNTNTPSDWERFYNSKYYTWIRNIFFTIIALIIFKDVFRSIKFKRTRSPRNSRFSRPLTYRKNNRK